jgi:hypothetical protein
VLRLPVDTFSKIPVYRMHLISKVFRRAFQLIFNKDYADGDRNRMKNSDNSASTSVDLADEVKGMYRLLDLISESGSSGYGKNLPHPLRDCFATPIRHILVDKVIIAQDSLQRFINTMSPGAYASITKVDFKTLDRLAIKPLGIYGCKDEIVRLLQSLGAVDKTMCVDFSGVICTSHLSQGPLITRAK